MHISTVPFKQFIHKCEYFCNVCLHRDIYYNDTRLFVSQTSVDRIIDDISCMLKIPRRSLHVVNAHFSLKDGLHYRLTFGRKPLKTKACS